MRPFPMESALIAFISSKEGALLSRHTFDGLIITKLIHTKNINPSEVCRNSDMNAFVGMNAFKAESIVKGRIIS